MRYGRNNRHHAPHDFSVGEAVVLHRFPDKKYAGVVEKVTPTRVTVTYDTPRGGKLTKTFWGATGVEIGGFSSSPYLRKAESSR